MALQYGLYAESQQSGANKPHILSFLTARTAAGDTLFEVWNGATNAARAFVVGLNGEQWGADGSVAAPVFSFLSDPDSGLYRIGANNIGVAVGGAKVVDVAAAGVGITGTLGSSGNFAINTNKFTVAASTGNTAVAGTLAVTGVASLAAALNFTGTAAIQESGTERGRIASGALRWGTTTALGAAGDIVVANGKTIGCINQGGNTVLGIKADATTDFVLNINTGATASSGGYVRIPFTTAAVLPAGDAAYNGVIVGDSTNNRLCFYIGGSRYYATLTAF